jgi:uridine phosphorylase
VAPSKTIHLHPTNELAKRVLLPGDPGRALALAQWLLEKPLMFNHHRGLWGYTGVAGDGELLSIQSTGMGGPSAAIVLHELAMLGAERAIRVGTCGALNGELALGELLVAREAIAADGTSRALGAGERVAGDARLTQALERAASERLEQQPCLGATQARPSMGATVVSTDLFYEHRAERERQWREGGAVAVEMEAAALFAMGQRLGMAVGCVLIVSDVLGAQRQRIDDEALQVAAEAMGRLAATALPC